MKKVTETLRDKVNEGLWGVRFSMEVWGYLTVDARRPRQGYKPSTDSRGSLARNKPLVPLPLLKDRQS